MRVAVGLAAACVAAMSACGGEDGANAKRYEGDQKEVAAAIDDLQSAAREGDGEKICDDLFGKKLRADIAQQTGESCEARVKEQFAAKETTLTVKQVRMRGEKSAVVNVTDQEGSTSVLYLEDDDGWRLVRIAR